MPDKQISNQVENSPINLITSPQFKKKDLNNKKNNIITHTNEL